MNRKKISLMLLVIFAFASFAFSQEGKQATEKPKKPKKEKQQPFNAKTATAEQIVEACIVIYGGLGGRETLKQIRRTSVEFGKVSFVKDDGTSTQVNYEKRILRGDSLDTERLRIDREYPDAKYALVYNDKKIFGIYNETVFVPDDETMRAFDSQMWHGIDALLRYIENGSKIEITSRDKTMGVDYATIEVTDKQNRKTRFFVSTKTFRVIRLEYQEGDVKYFRKFYDYRYAQGTLVPYRTTLFANDKLIEEANVSTITFGQKLDESIFQQVRNS